MPSVSDNTEQRRVIEEPLKRVDRTKGNTQTTLKSLAEVWGYRHLLELLIRRELKAKYKNSSLGIVWSLMRPLSQLLIYLIAIGHFLGAAKSIPEFAIFVFSGLTLWGFFSELITSGTTSITSNASLVKKVYFPREIFPLASLGGALFNLMVQFFVLLSATLILGQAPIHPGILYLPLAIAIATVFGMGLALILGAINVYLRDVEHLVEIFILIFFWLSPIVYSLRLVHERLAGGIIEQVYLLNPMTLATVGMQKAMWIAGSKDHTQYWPPFLAERMFVTFAFGLIFVWIGHKIFSRLQNNFAQEL